MTKTERHVTDLLNQIDLEGQVADVALRLLRTGRRNDPISGVATVIEEWVIAQAKQRYGADLDLRNPGDQVVADARDIAAALHLLSERSVRPLRRPSADDPAQITRVLEAVEPDFPERLLLELRRREGRNATFARDLGQARAWVASTALSLQRSLREREVDDGGDMVEQDGANGISIILKDNPTAIGVIVILVLVATAAIWYFAERSAAKND